MIPTLDSRTVLKVADQKGRVALGSRYAGKHFAVREDSDGTSTLTPVQVIPDRDRPLTSQRLDESFASLESLKDNWDDRGSSAPSPAMIACGREALALLHAGSSARNLLWQDPHIGSNERGEITLEWWNGPRALTVFVRSKNRLDYLKSWGSNIESEMEDGEIVRLSDFAALSSWLNMGDRAQK